MNRCYLLLFVILLGLALVCVFYRPRVTGLGQSVVTFHEPWADRTFIKDGKKTRTLALLHDLNEDLAAYVAVPLE